MEKMRQLTYKGRPGHGQASRGRLSCKVKSPRLHGFRGELTSFRGLKRRAVPVCHGTRVSQQVLGEGKYYEVGPQARGSHRQPETGLLM